MKRTNNSTNIICLSILLTTLIFTLPGCDDEDNFRPETTADDTGLPDDTETQPESTQTQPDQETVKVTVHLVDAMSNGGISGAEVSNEDSTENTNADGNALLQIPASSPFELIASANNYQTYHLFGMSGEDDFVLTSFGSSKAVTEATLNSVSLAYDETKAIVVVGLDTVALAPAVGASASIDVAHDDPFVFEGAYPKAGDTIVAGGMSMVTFPNVVPGPVKITVTPPQGQTCHAYPGPQDLTEITAHADHVSVISYICK